MPIYHRRINGRMRWWARVTVRGQKRSALCVTREGAVQAETRLLAELERGAPTAPRSDLPACLGPILESLGMPTHVIPAAGHQLPVVYAWVSRHGVLRYVGMSTRGLRRPLGSNHQWLWHVAHAADDALYVWACPSVADARRMEDEMLRIVRPTGNRAFPHTRRNFFGNDNW
jgi:hypothetical protein